MLCCLMALPFGVSAVNPCASGPVRPGPLFGAPGFLVAIISLDLAEESVPGSNLLTGVGREAVEFSCDGGLPADSLAADLGGF